MLKIMEMLNNRTCGECKWFNKIVGIHCTWHEIEMHPNEEACGDFEPLTNGDRIISMRDEKLAELFIYTRREHNGDKCYLSTIRVGKWSSRAEAKAATIEELKKEAEDE